LPGPPVTSFTLAPRKGLIGSGVRGRSRNLRYKSGTIRAGFAKNGEIMKSRAVVVGLLATGLCGVAQAEAQGFYAGSGAGMYYVDIDGLELDESAATLRLFGGYKLNQYLSFEAGYSNLFEASGDALGADVELD